MAELTTGLDELPARFSTNFVDELDPSKSAKDGDIDSDPPQSTPEPKTPVSTNPFRSESPTPSDQGLEIHQDSPSFDFAAHLETHDSMSSLDQIGATSPTSSNQSASPAHQPRVNGVSDDTSETTNQKAATKAPPTLVARTSERWETFDENGKKVSEPHPPTANGGQKKEPEIEKKGVSLDINISSRERERERE